VSRLPEALLAAAAVATIVALLYPPLARWAWPAAAAAMAVWAALASGISAGMPLFLGVVLATALDRGDAPARSAFNNVVARIAALAGAVLAALLVTSRVLLVDLVNGFQPFTLMAIGLAALFYMLAHGGPVEESRAARLALVTVAAGWAAAGHPGITVPLAVAALLLVMALVPRRMRAA